VPHGDTVIQKGDRVVVIGDPAILPSIATHIGSGESEFPRHYGSNIVALGNRDNYTSSWLTSVERNLVDWYSPSVCCFVGGRHCIISRQWEDPFTGGIPT